MTREILEQRIGDLQARAEVNTDRAINAFKLGTIVTVGGASLELAGSPKEAVAAFALGAISYVATITHSIIGHGRAQQAVGLETAHYIHHGPDPEPERVVSDTTSQ
jgi:hypothetical protein